VGTAQGQHKACKDTAPAVPESLGEAVAASRWARNNFKPSVSASATAVPPFALVTLGVIAASIEPALAQDVPVPAPIIGAGLPVLAVLGGGYWLIKKLRGRS